MGYFMKMLWRDREKCEDFVHDLFSKIINVTNKEEIYALFDFSVSEYWQTHYQFDIISLKKKKKFKK